MTAAVADPPVAIRAIRADDAAALLRFHAGLSPETVRRRFLVYHPDLSEREVAWFTHVDHDSREALVAFDGAEIAGIARYDRIDGTSAEVAIVVADAWQRRGVGSALLSRLAERATEAGVTELVADTLPENVGIVRLLNRVGVVYDRDDADGVARIRVRLAGPAGERTLGRQTGGLRHSCAAAPRGGLAVRRSP